MLKLAQTAAEKLTRFRERLSEWFRYRSDALVNVLDSLCGNTTARSVVELSLNAPFTRKYSSLFDAVSHLEGRKDGETTVPWCDLLEGLLPEPEQRTFYLLTVDTTAQLRPYARTLPDRGIIYTPNPAPGNKPIGVGHSYSVAAFLPERAQGDAPWVVPLSCERVATDEKSCTVGAEQIQRLLNDDHLPFKSTLSVVVADSHYSQAAFLNPLGQHDSTIVVTRFARNRKLYRSAVPSSKRHVGHPTWHGDPVKPSQPDTLRTPDEEEFIATTTRRGEVLTIRLRRWKNLLLADKRLFPMHDHPLDLMSVEAIDSNGQPLYAYPLWLIIMGARRDEISLQKAYEAYAQRYDIEHFFRFGKQRLLISAFQTSSLEHEEAWWTLGCLATIQLWLIAPLATWQPQPWERYAPSSESRRTLLTPSKVQRQFTRIIRPFGTPAHSPKPRGYSPGRRSGTKLIPRIKYPIIFKNRSPPKKAA